MMQPMLFYRGLCCHCWTVDASLVSLFDAFRAYCTYILVILGGFTQLQIRRERLQYDVRFLSDDDQLNYTCELFTCTKRCNTGHKPSDL